jgi:hypothetical protein
VRLKIYFDTNVYSLIARERSELKVRQMLDQLGHSVVGSFMNLQETWDASEAERVSRMRAINVVSRTIVEYPDGYEQAKEVLSEIRRCRSQWIVRSPNTSSIEDLKQFWRTVRLQSSADYRYVPSGKQVHDSIALPDRARGLAQSKQTRQMLLESRRSGRLVGLWTYDLELDHELLKYDLPEREWRLTAFGTWRSALIHKQAHTSDLYDWTGPYLRMDTLHVKDLALFWLRDARPSAVKRHRIIGLTEHYQLERKIESGNPNDAIHAMYMLGHNAFVTGDKAFFDVLCMVARHARLRTKLVFIDQRSDNPVREIRLALSNARSVL